MKTHSTQSFSSIIAFGTSELNALLKKFWDDEEISITHAESKEDEYCEKFYSGTHLEMKMEDTLYDYHLDLNFPNKYFLDRLDLLH